MSQPTELASIIAGEASGIEAQQAVLNVIMNRAAVNFGGHGTTWIAQATAPLQFSAYPDHLGTPTADTYAMIQAAIDGKLGNIVPKALNYANPHLASAAWVQTANASGQGVNIGGNVFWANDQGGSPGFDPSKIWSPSAPSSTPPAASSATGTSAMDPAIVAAIAQFAPVIESLVAGIFRGAGTALAPALPTILSQLSGGVLAASATPVASTATDMHALAAALAPLIKAQIQPELDALSAEIAKLTGTKP